MNDIENFNGSSSGNNLQTSKNYKNNKLTPTSQPKQLYETQPVEKGEDKSRRQSFNKFISTANGPKLANKSGNCSPILKSQLASTTTNFGNRSLFPTQYGPSISQNQHPHQHPNSVHNSPDLGDKKIFSGKQQVFGQFIRQYNFSKSCLKSLMNIGSNMIMLFNSLLQEGDIYNLIKQYIENVQDISLREIEEASVVLDRTDPQFKIIMNAFKLEKWAVMFYFFFSFEKLAYKKMNSILKFLIRKVAENFSIACNGFFLYSPRNG